MGARRTLPRVLTVAALSSAGCSSTPTQDAGVDSGTDAGTDAGCTLPSDFPPDTSSFLIDAVCNCPKVAAFHCYEEGGPRCFSWACYPQAAPDGGYAYQSDGGVQC